MPLAHHAGAGDGRRARPARAAMMPGGPAAAEPAAIHFMIFSGVFERHPGLRVVLTEPARNVGTPTAVEYDSLYLKWPAESDFRRRYRSWPAST